MGWKPVETTYSSDSFQLLYDMAIKLIEVRTRGQTTSGRGCVQELQVYHWGWFLRFSSPVYSMKECRMLFVLSTSFR